ncbi:MAG: aminotransferase class V-fold PLP-dependent enzyme, partial [Novosphingobium sp.]
TENLPGAMAMAAALESGRDWMGRVQQQRQWLETALVQFGGVILGDGVDRIATVGAVRMPGVSAAAQLIRFDGMGIAVSAGSACSSGSLKTSHVLGAMAVEGASEVIRVSIGRETADADLQRFIDAWRAIAGRS